MGAWIPIVAAVAGAVVSAVANRAASSNSSSGSSGSSSGEGLQTQNISRFTPEQEALFKKLMSTSLQSGFSQADLPRLKGPIPRLYGPNAVNSAFSSYGV